MQLPKVMIFCKAPIEGEAKTRLAKDIGNKSAIEVHRQLVKHCLDRVCALKSAEIELWAWPSKSHPYFKSIENNYKISIRTQVDGNLGRKMAHAFCSGDQGQSKLIIGTDCPTVDVDYLERAIEVLKSGADYVVGPAEDGGYVLIGMNDADLRVFEDIDWGTDCVLRQTLEKMQGKINLLNTMWDVDNKCDLERLSREREICKISPEFSSYLTKCIPG